MQKNIKSEKSIYVSLRIDNSKIQLHFAKIHRPQLNFFNLLGEEVVQAPAYTIERMYKILNFRKNTNLLYNIRGNDVSAAPVSTTIFSTTIDLPRKKISIEVKSSPSLYSMFVILTPEPKQLLDLNFDFFFACMINYYVILRAN